MHTLRRKPLSCVKNFTLFTCVKYMNSYKCNKVSYDLKLCNFWLTFHSIKKKVTSSSFGRVEITITLRKENFVGRKFLPKTEKYGSAKLNSRKKNHFLPLRYPFYFCNCPFSELYLNISFRTLFSFLVNNCKCFLKF